MGRINWSWKPQGIHKEHISPAKKFENRSGTCIHTSHAPGEGDINNGCTHGWNERFRTNHH